MTIGWYSSSAPVHCQATSLVDQIIGVIAVYGNFAMVGKEREVTVGWIFAAQFVGNFFFVGDKSGGVR